jgi:hypothetical protein
MVTRRGFQVSLHLFGIRHHGAGGARSLLRALRVLEPDCVLVEGPPDANDLLPLLGHADMTPPIALLLHAKDDPSRAVYYPFAVFSPEFQAILYALEQQITVRFMDLPQAHQLTDHPNRSGEAHLAPEPDDVAADPLGWLARAAGFSDGERYWEFLVEQRRSDEDVFAAILEAMTALRLESNVLESREAQREAFMRQSIRKAQKDGFKRIAVVSGAWHSPVLNVENFDAKADAALLEGLPKTVVSSTWIPWTHGRLARSSGYGAGITSPGWYAHLWALQDSSSRNVVSHWLTKVAHLLRAEDLPASSASVIEAVRLAEALAALRGSPMPGLDEMNEVCWALFAWDSDLPLELIREKLILAETLGAVPPETPTVPLVRDLEAEQKRLRFKPDAVAKNVEFDLRIPNDLERSVLLHRLRLLGVPWGEVIGSSGKGTFKEAWRVQWHPEFAVRLIEGAMFGSTVLDAATQKVLELSSTTSHLPSLTKLLDDILLSNLPNAAELVMKRLEAAAAQDADINHLMQAIPPLARVQRYGSVRQFNTKMLAGVVSGLVLRVCVGLPNACAGLSDEAALELFPHFLEFNSAIATLEQPDLLIAWREVLQVLAVQHNLHGLIAGRASRLLLEAGIYSAEDTAKRLSYVAGIATDPNEVAAWTDGFLRGSGLMLVHDDALFGVLDSWVQHLSPEAFIAVLPLMRRTFSSFDEAERRDIGQKVKTPRQQLTSRATQSVDVSRAEKVIPLTAQMLGIQP